MVTDEMLQELRRVGDPVADECALVIVSEDGAHSLDQLMAGVSGGSFPEHPAIATYFLRTAELPSWADGGAIQRTQSLYAREHQAVLTVMGFAALPESYCNVTVARTLARYSSLTSHRLRRVERTAEFVSAVLSPGGLAEGSLGRETIRRVRLLHALLRLRFAGLPDSDVDPGRAINQEDLAGTLLTLSWLTPIRLARLGLRLDANQIEDYAHTWNVVGAMLGVDERLLPERVEEAIALLEAIRRRQYGATAEGTALTSALLEAYEQGPFPPFVGRVLIRQLLGEELAELLNC